MIQVVTVAWLLAGNYQQSPMCNRDHQTPASSSTAAKCSKRRAVCEEHTMLITCCVPAPVTDWVCPPGA
jgi:hypothetical protein